MFDGRSKYLLLNKREDLSTSARAGLKEIVEIVEFMRENRRAFWLFCHLSFIHYKLDDYSNELHLDRKKECNAVKKQYKKLLNEKVSQGLPESVLEEPGVWTFPVKYCFWTWMDESLLNDQGHPFTLMDQLELIDREEPARVQCNSCTSLLAVELLEWRNLVSAVPSRIVPALSVQASCDDVKFEEAGMDVAMTDYEAGLRASTECRVVRQFAGGRPSSLRPACGASSSRAQEPTPARGRAPPSPNRPR
ncbi:unnamed protein product [Phytophthora fragariaefolia]|uniref:Unnamed protein product n=1 Tax=Phytophthora fragariaefolia TaxID=1490495 RepID=A0A9W7D0B8_9STRA|nr:unnamed protein product [Phytophthora fragariaefolia]